MPFAVACDNTQKVTVVATPLTATGRPASLDGGLTVTVLSGDGTVEQDPALPLQYKAVSGLSAGDTVYLVSGDADLSTGITTISDRVTLTVTAAIAAGFGFAAGPIEAK